MNDNLPLPLYSHITRDVMVMVQPEYLPDLSRPDEHHFVWAYHILIENGGVQTVTLLRRHWKIIDGNGTVIEVSGDGVIGEQPVLQPGGHYRYSSGTPLVTPSGIMMGTYEMRTESGDEFAVTIPSFSLDSELGSRMMH